MIGKGRLASLASPSTNALDLHTKAQSGAIGSCTVTSATILASIRLLKSVRRVDGSRLPRGTLRYSGAPKRADWRREGTVWGEN